MRLWREISPLVIRPIGHRQVKRPARHDHVCLDPPTEVPEVVEGARQLNRCVTARDHLVNRGFERILMRLPRTPDSCSH